MVVRFTISSNADKFIRDLQKRKRKISKRMSEKLRVMGQDGKRYAFQIAPKQSGKTEKLVSKPLIVEAYGVHAWERGY